MTTKPENPAMTPHDHTGCIAHVIAHAEKVAAEDGVRFTPVRRRALEILLESHAALGAYDLLKR
ncbi:MAG: transcriptional repressor, partial [Pikeienuella sp.]